MDLITVRNIEGVIKNVKEDQGEKLIQTFFVPKLPSIHEVLRRRKAMWYIS